jgi:site-specific DNA-methyltransferase (adenine-specific)
MTYKILNGDCFEVLKTLEDNSVDSIVTDPPYGLSQHSQQDVIDCLRAWISGEIYSSQKKGFMNKEWDAWVPGPEVWKEVLRVLKLGGHILAFAGTRSMDLMCMSIRLAGFELRDSIGYAHDKGEAPVLAYVYGSGFPKGHNISKAIDKSLGANGDAESECQITAPAAPEAKKWEGFSTALKPSWEPLILARKPLEGTVAENVLKYGTGGLNIDDCRIEFTSEEDKKSWKYGAAGKENTSELSWKNTSKEIIQNDVKGRWPANVITDDSEEVLKLFPETKGKVGMTGKTGKALNKVYSGVLKHQENRTPGVSDSGSAARIFYCAKASKKDRNEGLKNTENTHPTVKPTSLMRYLCRLITPPGGTVLDPFMGSGSTGKGALLEEFDFIGIELDSNYCEIADQRLRAIKPKVKLDDIFQ